MPDTPKDIEIDIDNLLLDQNNPRIPATDGQEHAIKEMISQQGDKLYELAIHISENEMSPLHRLAVIASENETDKYIVIEGNRRAAAVKLVICPDLASGTSLAKKFANLHKLYANKIQKQMHCCLFSNSEKAKEWRKVEHYGESGVHQENWSAIAKIRQDSADGKETPQSLVLNHVLPSPFLNEETKKIVKGNEFKVSKLERIIKSKKTKNILGISFQNNKINFKHDENWTLEALSKIIEIIANGQSQGGILTLEDIYKAHQIEKFVQQVVDEIGDRRNNQNIKNNEDNKNQINPSSNIKKINPPSPSPPKQLWDRDSLIPKSHTPPSFNSKKLKKVYWELREYLKTDDIEIAVALSFRTLLEISVTEYCEKNGIQFKNERTPVIEKLKAALKDMKDNKRITEDESKLFAKLTNDEPLALTRELNIYVHDMEHMPTKQILHERWDLTVKLFDKLWEYS